MKQFGLLKSQIEQHLMESYKNGSIKSELKNFKLKVLGNKKISKVYHLYNELTEQKGINESVAKELVNECINVYNSLNIKESDFNVINRWVGKIKVKNKYSDVDNIFSSDVLKLESKIKSKLSIVENLKSNPSILESKVNIPLKSMVQIANQTFENYVSQLNESEKKELMGVLTIPENELTSSFKKLQNETIEKLNSLYEGENDNEVKGKITETINKIKNQNIDKLSFFKLKKLNETI